MSPNAGGGGGVAVQLYTGAQIKSEDLTPYLIIDSWPMVIGHTDI